MKNRSKMFPLAAAAVMCVGMQAAAVALLRPDFTKQLSVAGVRT